MKATTRQKNDPRQVACLILVGGLGTRLRRVLPDAPKPMATIAGKPFLEHLLIWIGQYGFHEIVLCAGYRAQQIRDYFGDGEKFGLRLNYSLETEPLGTWGAIRQAKRWISHSYFLVLNGDSWVDVDLLQLLDFHHMKCGLATIALAKVENVARFGSVQIDASGRVTRFVEKETPAGPALVNAGVYAFHCSIFAAAPAAANSLEKDVFPAILNKGIYGLPVGGLFLDIGVAEDYENLRRNPEVWLRGLGMSAPRKATC